MAEPPQIEDPTPINVASFVSRLKKALEKESYNQGYRMVERITGREDFPTAKTCEILSPIQVR